MGPVSAMMAAAAVAEFSEEGEGKDIVPPTGGVHDIEDVPN